MKKKNILRCVVAALLLTVSIVTGCGGESREPVVFGDSNIERIVRDSINQPEGAIYPENLMSVTRLELSSWYIQDLTGLEHCTSLVELDLSTNKISDLSPLSSLEKLEILDVSANPVNDLSPLSHCRGLKSLMVYGGTISDLTPLGNLDGLETLHIPMCGITSLHGLEGLTSLTILNLGGNEFSDISPLSGLVSLELLNIGRINPSIDLPIYEGMDEYEVSDFFVGIDDFSPLAGLENLRELYLDACLIEDVSQLAGLSKLEQLSLRFNYIEDSSPLTALKKLKTLSLVYNPITDIEEWTHYTLAEGQSMRIELDYCPLDERSVSTFLPAMEEAGIWVRWQEIHTYD